MSKIYVPEKESYKCYVVQGEGTIRAYKQKPTNNSNIEYRDYYIRSNYIYRDGNQSFGYNSSLPICLEEDSLTSEVYYRNDFADILIIFLIMSIFCFLIPLKIFSKLFRRRL